MIIHCPHDAMVSVKELKPNPLNRNSHPKDQVERLAKILEYQGWRYPIKVSKRSGLITSGHGRLEAAKLLKLKEVPVSFQDYVDEAQEYADTVSDNSIASWSELDLSGINSDIVELGPDFDLDLLGIQNFKLDIGEKIDEAIEQLNEERDQKFILEAQFPNEMEMMEAHDNLLHQGYLVKVK
jgi:hypothetical protein